MLVNEVSADVDSVRNQFLGITEQGGGSDKPVIDPDVFKRLSDIEGQANPEPPTVKDDETKEVPDYLKELQPDLATQLPELKEDYNAMFEASFGEKPQAPIETREQYEDMAVEFAAYDEYIQKQNIAHLEAIASGSVEEGSLVQQYVQNMLHNQTQGLYTQGQLDQIIGELFTDGKLNEKGKQKHEAIIGLVKQDIENVKKAAKDYAQKQVEDARKYVGTLNTVGAAFKVAGVELDKEVNQHLINQVRTGNIYEWINTSATPEEHVQKQLMLALISSKTAFAKFVEAIDKRGVEYATAKKLASQLS